MNYIFLAGWVLNIIGCVFFIVQNYNNCKNLNIAELIVMIAISICPFAMVVICMMEFVDFNKVIIKGKKK